MNKTLEEVLEFHKTYGAHAGKEIGDVSLLRWKLRVKLILEELFELSAELSIGHASVFTAVLSSELEKFREEYYKLENKAQEPAKILKEAADLQYVVSGTFIEAGVHHLLDKAHTLTHISNMSKLCKDMYTAQISIEDNIKRGKIKDASEAIIEEGDKGLVLMRKSDRKVLKSVDFKPALPAIEDFMANSSDEEFEYWIDKINKKHVEDTKRLSVENAMSSNPTTTSSPSTGKKGVEELKKSTREALGEWPKLEEINDPELSIDFKGKVSKIEKGWEEHIPAKKIDEEE
jgi:predicted HAD superfamily Cof-like phosphohydrolase